MVGLNQFSYFLFELSDFLEEVVVLGFFQADEFFFLCLVDSGAVDDGGGTGVEVFDFVE